MDSQTTTPEKVLGAVAAALFKEGQTTAGRITPGASNAELNLQGLSGALRSFINSGWMLGLADVSIQSRGSILEYLLVPKQAEKTPPSTPLADYILIRIHVCSGATKASAVMKGYLEDHDALGAKNPYIAIRPLRGLPLGDCALGTPSSIFWIRGDSVFVRLVRSTDPNSKAKPGTSSTHCRRPPPPLFLSFFLSFFFPSPPFLFRRLADV